MPIKSKKSKPSTVRVNSFPGRRALACLLLLVLYVQTVAPPAMASPRTAPHVAALVGSVPQETRALIGRAASSSSALASSVLAFFSPSVAAPAAATGETWSVVLTPVLTEFRDHAGLDHHPQSRSLVLSANSPTGQPNSFDTIAADGSHTAFSNIVGLNNDVLIATARDDGQGLSRGGFKPGELFASAAGAPGVVVRVSADGATVQNPWVTLPGENAKSGGLHLDRTGVFGGDLLAVTASGGVWRVSATGTATLLVNLGTQLAGAAVVPDDVERYGPLAGKLLTGAKEQGGLYTVNAQGQTSFFDLGVSPRDIDLIPAHENFYTIDSGSRALLGVPASAFTGIIGDILITQGTPGALSRVRWDGTTLVVSQLGEAAELKQSTFSPAGVSQIGAVKQVYESIAVVRHAPALSSGRVEGALWQLLAENVTLSGNSVITSDLLVPGKPTVTASGGSFGGVIEGVESPLPTGYQVTLSGNASLRHVVNRTDPVTLENVPAPPAPAGTRIVSLSKASENFGDAATLRDLSLSGKAGAVAVPPGTYGKFSVSGQAALVLGVASSTVPTVYNLEELSLSGGSELRLAGSVVLHVKNAVTLSGSTVGVADSPQRLLLKVAGSVGDGVKISGNGVLYGIVRAPQRGVNLSGNGRLRGTVSCDRLTVSGNGVLQITENDVPPPAVNRPPAADAGADQIITLPVNTVNLNGVVGDDGLPAGSTLTTTWSKTSGPGSVVFSDIHNAASTATFSAPGDYVLKLVASDGQLQSSDKVSVKVLARNQPPTVNAGTDQTLELPGTAELRGTVSDDALPHGSTVTVLWSKTSGPGIVSFGDANAIVTNASFSAPGTYTLRLTAHDTEFDSSDEVTFVVLPENQPPVVNAGGDQTISLPGGANLSGSISDDGLPEAATLTSMWEKVSGPGEISFANTAQAHTSASFSAPGAYVLKLTASDTQLSASDEITITVEPANLKPSVNAGADQSITLPGQAVLQGSATDDGLPRSASLTTTWSKVSGPGALTFSAANSLTTTASFSEAGTYVLRLSASDTDLTGEDDVIITVKPENRAPVVNAGADQAIALPNVALLNGSATDDNLPEGVALSVAWSVVGAPGAVAFSSPNTTTTSVTFGAPGTYVLRLTATDSQLSEHDDVIVIVNPPLNLPPVVNAGADKAIQLPANASLQGTVSDDGMPAGGASFVAWSKVSGAGDVTFANPALAATTAAFSAPGSYVLRLTASDSEFSTSDDVTITVAPAPAPPVAAFSFAPGNGENIISLPGRTNAARQSSPALEINGGEIVRYSGRDTRGGDAGRMLHYNFNLGGWITKGVADNYAVVRLAGGDVYRLTGVKVAPYFGYANPGSGVKNFEVWVSATTDDDAAFTKVLSATAAPNETIQTFMFPGGAVAARYVKYVPLTGVPNVPTIGTYLFDVITETASGGVVGESSRNGFQRSELAIDSDTSTSWLASGGTNQWVKIQLADHLPRRLYGVRVHPTPGFAPKHFQVRVSTTTADDAAFSTVFTGLVDGSNNNAQEFQFNQFFEARYVQFYWLDGYNNSLVGVRELEALAVPDEGSVLIGSSGEKSELEGASLALDVDSSNFPWRTKLGQTTDQWLKIMLPRAELWNIDEIALYPGAESFTNESPKDFKLQVSTTDQSDTSFATVFTGKLQNSQTLQTFRFPPVAARYVRLLLVNHYGGQYMSLHTFRVISPDAGSRLARFLDQSHANNGSIASYRWEFGDGATSNEREPQHEYAAAGDYTVALTVTDGAGLTSRAEKLYRAFDPFAANFAASPLTTNEGGESLRLLDFTSRRFGSIFKHYWNFGDGSLPFETYSRSAGYSYNDNGTYQITLRVVAPNGVNLTTTREVRVQNLPPTVTIETGKTVVWGEVWSNLPKLSDPSPADLFGYSTAWDFGDGQTASCAGCNNTNSATTHAYALPGSYTVTLVATDKDGGVSAPVTTNYIVTKRPVTLTVVSALRDATGDTGTVRVRLQDGFDAGPLAARAVGITLNGRAANAVTDASGFAEATLPLAAGTAPGLASADYAGEAMYDSGGGVLAFAPDQTAPRSCDCDSRGRDFWIMFPQNDDPSIQDYKPAELSLYISAEQATTGTVSVPGLNFSTNYSVAARGVTAVRLPVGTEADLFGQTQAKGIHVTSDANVSVYGFSFAPFTTDGFLALPTSSLGTRYVNLGYPNGFASSVVASEFGIVATADATTVTITPSSIAGTHLAGIPYTVTLGRGQTYQLRSNPLALVPGNDLSGSRINSDKPIAVFGGNQLALVPFGTSAGNYVVEQLLPANTWGTRFAAAPLAARPNQLNYVYKDTYRFLASTDNTHVYINNALAATINRGQVYEHSSDQYVYIVTDHPVLAAQFASGRTGVTFRNVEENKPGDPSMIVVMPLDSFLGSYTLTTPLPTAAMLATRFHSNYVNIVVPTNTIGSVKLDNVNVAPNRFTAIGTSGYSGAQLALTNGTHNLTGAKPFGATIYGFADFDAYGYPGGVCAGFPLTGNSLTLAPATSTAVIGAAASSCVVATLTDVNRIPLTDRALQYKVEGANALTGEVVTDAAGQAQICYAGANAGQDLITATYGTANGTAGKRWLPSGPNAAPQVNAGTDQSITLPAVSVLLEGSIADDGLPQDSIPTSTWTKQSGPGSVTFTTPAAPATTATFDAAGTYVLRLTASDGELSASDEVTIVVVSPNLAPQVSAGTDQTITLPAAAQLSGAVTDDNLPAGGSLGVLWSKVSGAGEVVFAEPARTSTAANFSAPGLYVLRLTASDTALSASSDVTVNVLPPVNVAPTVNAGAAQTTTLPGAATLTGSASDDGLPQPGSLSVAWSKVGGPGEVAFSAANATNTNASFASAGSYVLRLTATDGELSATSDVSITVNPAPVNNAPAVDAGADQTASLGANLITNGGNEAALASGEIVGWVEVAGNSWTQAGGAGLPAPRRGSHYFYAGETAQAELRQDIDLSAFAGAIAAGTQSFVFRASVRSREEAVPDTARVVVEYRDHTNTQTLATLDSDAISSTGSWHLTEDTRPAPPGTGWMRVRLIAARQTGTTNDAYFDDISLRPSGTPAAVVKLGGTASDDGQPAGSSLTTTWSVVSGAGAVAFAGVSDASSAATFDAAGVYVLRLTATDGALTTSDDVTVTIKAANVAPVASAGADSSVTLPDSVTLAGGYTDDGEPEGSSVSVGWTKLSGPGAVTFGNSTQGATTATFDAAGTYVLRLTADDGEYDASDDVTLTVNPEPVNQAPTVNAGANQSLELPVNTATLNGTVTDDNLPRGGVLAVAWSVVSGTAGAVTFANAQQAATTATFSAQGTYVLRLTASDSQLSASADVTVSVRPANAAPIVDAGADASTPLNIAAQLAATVTDDGLPAGGQLTLTWSRVSGAGDVTFANANVPVTPATFSAPGIYVLRLTASDSQLSAGDEVTITVEEAQAPPTVEIIAPADGADVTSPASVVGTVSNGAWKLEYSLNTSDGETASGVPQTWTTFASGTGAQSGASLGTLDPTMMLNGIYTLRLTATDAYGQSVSDSMGVVVDKNLKVGNFTVSFVDLSIPMAGMPIEVVRTYDSRDKRKGDFGIGWTLGLRNVRVEKTRVIGRDWIQTRTSTFPARYCVEPTRPHLVTVTFPDNRTYKFRAGTSPQCQAGGPIGGATINFAPMPGTHGSLAVEGSADVLVAGSVPGPVDLIGFNNPDIFNTAVFRLTTEDGTQYVIDQAGGVRSVRDLNGNTLTVNASGIHHSSGQSIAFTRDSEGRISQITDPTSNSIVYGYDAQGDLESYRDRELQTTTYAYNSTHLLVDIKDPLGRHPVRNEYDPISGRLLRHIDAYNKEVVYAHDLAARRETVTNRLGHQSIFEYDERGNVLYSRDAEGGEKRFVYDELDNLRSETNELNQKTTYDYDAQGNRTLVKDPLDHETKFTYNTIGRMLTVTDALDRTTTNIYDSGGNLKLTKDALDNETKYTYDAFTGKLKTKTDALNGETLYDYDSAGNLTKETNALNRFTTYTYGALGTRKSQTTTRKLPDGSTQTLTTNYEYDREGRLTKTTYPDDSTTKIEYNQLGQQAVTIDQSDRRTLYAYDNMGRLVKTTYPDTKTEEIVYDLQGRRTKTIDRAKRETTYDYDRTGRLLKTNYPDGKFTTTVYDAAGRVIKTLDALDQETLYEYDAAGRRKTVTDALSNVTKFDYDANGNQTLVTDDLLRSTRFEYDKLGRRVKTIYMDDTFEEVVYDKLGRTISKRDQAGKLTRFEYDKLGRLLNVKDEFDQTTSYEYDELGQQISQTDALNHTTRFEYDRMGRRARRVLPLGQTESYTYHADGTLASRTDFNGKTTAYAYDSFRRLLQKTFDASLNQPAVNYTYTATGQRESMSDATGATGYVYDSRNRLTAKTTPQGALSYTYNANGNLLTLRSSNANGVSVDYAYDALNRLKQATDNRQPAGANTTHYTYDDVGNLDSYTYPNQVKSTYSYNALNRLTNLTVANSSATLSGYTYTLGAAGNRTAVAEQGGRTVSYTYDALYRLTSETITNDPAGANGAVGYVYDAVGNRLSRTSTLPGIAAGTSTYDHNDRLTSETSDAQGNTLTAQGNTYTFDAENRLTSLNNGAATYLYDGDGHRVGKTAGGVTTRYLVDTNNLTGYAQVVDELVGGSVTRSYTHGHDLISQRQLGNSEWRTSYYGYDGHGSVRLLTDTQGAVTDTYTYDAFGNLIARTGTTPNEHLYAGERLDAETGMYYLRARYMQPGTGRFWSTDTYEGVARDPLTLHKYLYANGNPVNSVDPTGHSASAISLGAVGMIGTLSAMAVVKFLGIGLAVATTACVTDLIGTSILREEGFDVGGFTPCSRDNGPKITLYRGVNEKHAAIADARLGIAKPNRRWWQFWKLSPSTPYEHNTVQEATINSVFTSWTLNPLVAENFALRDQNSGHTLSTGVVLEAEIPVSRTMPGPDMHKIFHPTLHEEIPEQEVLVRGVIRGAKVRGVP